MLRVKNYVYSTEEALIPAHMNFGLYVLNKCREFNENIAMIAADTGETMTYSQLVKLSIDIALSLVRLGVKRGDVICVLSENRVEFMPLLLGITCAGATFLAGDVNQRLERVLHRINITKPKIIFCSQYAYDIHKNTLKEAHFVENVIVYGDEEKDGKSFIDFLSPRTAVQDYQDFQPIPVDGWRDIALIIFSSGTTGLPKAVPMTHVNILSLYQIGLNNDISPGKPMLVTRDFYFTYGLLHSIKALLVGSPVVFTTKTAVEDYVNIVEKYKVKTLQLVPTIINELVTTPALSKGDVTSVETIVTSSMPVGGDLLETTKLRFQKLRTIIQVYGMTEMGCVTFHQGLDRKMDSVGTAVASAIIKVVDIKTREPLGPNERGEICFKSPSLMSGYMGDTTLDYMDEDGFFKSGDIGYYDEDKYFYIVDRIKNMIKYRGASISPAELESVLLLHPEVKDAGIAPTSHALLGEIPMAFVVLKPGRDVSETALMDYFLERVPTIKLDEIRFVSSLPRGSGEKLDRKALKSMVDKSIS